MEKIILCPKCKTRVAFYDGKGEINIGAKCRKCKVLVVYIIEKNEVVLRPYPVRTCSSGCEF